MLLLPCSAHPPPSPPLVHPALSVPRASRLPRVAAALPPQAAGGVSFRRYLEYLDERTSTSTLGFRVDACKTMIYGALDQLPLPDGVPSLGALQSEAHVSSALSAFLQHDPALAAAVCLKLETLSAALQRSSFFRRHALVRSTLLLVYDDVARSTKLELKMMNFGLSFPLSDAEIAPLTAPLDDPPRDEYGYLAGVDSLHRLMKQVCRDLEAGSAAVSSTVPVSASPGRV